MAARQCWFCGVSFSYDAKGAPRKWTIYEFDACPDCQAITSLQAARMILSNVRTEERRAIKVLRAWRDRRRQRDILASTPPGEGQ